MMAKGNGTALVRGRAWPRREEVGGLGPHGVLSPGLDRQEMESVPVSLSESV